MNHLHGAHGCPGYAAGFGKGARVEIRDLVGVVGFVVDAQTREIVGIHVATHQVSVHDQVAIRVEVGVIVG